MPSGEERSAKLRQFYARYVAAFGSARDPRIEQAFAAVPREPFAGPGPWSVPLPKSGYIVTPDDDPAFLYQDTLIAIDPARGINIGEPSLHARCLDALALRAGETVLHVGAGVGYYTAVLAHLVGSNGHVHAYEIDPGLAARAERNLAHFPWVAVHARSGVSDGLPEAGAIYVSAGATHPSKAWLDALDIGGRLLFPLHATGGFGGMLLVERPQAGLSWPARFVSRAGFIACQGLQDEAASPLLAKAFAARDISHVTSIEFGPLREPACWHAGNGWWLSKAPDPSGAA